VDGGPKGAEGGKETVVFPAENERKYAAGSVFFSFFSGKLCVIVKVAINHRNI